MSKVIKKAYAEEMKQGYNLRTAMEELIRLIQRKKHWKKHPDVFSAMMPLAARAAQQKRIQQNSSVPCVLEILKVLLKQSVKTIH